MKLCFNEATTLENSNLEKDLEICEAHGYDYIEIRTTDKLPEYLETHTLDDLADYFRAHHIKPLALNALEFFNNRDKEGHDAIIQEFQEMMTVCDKIGAKYVVAVPLVTTDKILKKDIKANSIAVLEELSDIAKPHGVKIAVEFIGHPECTVNTFRDAYDIVQTVDRDNVGLVFDSFHFHAMGSNIEDLKNADGSKIFLFHIDDTEDFQIGLLTDDDRVWPGHGTIDLDAHIATLKKIGYRDVVSVELFRPEYYKLTPEETIQKAKETTVSVISKHFNI
ncbi:2-keto-myo-inositol isomerase [Listeria grandensis]|uniref:2-keto-myo-inositol isomerase n=1 Tax=Listeria grandensis TaxID=1494963 RepID=UPI00164E38D7|nr:2-keto-myo-inositol isomerase [Listeria grandensis]MBC6316724.1 2-keto-myo-inositol isomerase [Listeria grandensis]